MLSVSSNVHRSKIGKIPKSLKNNHVSIIHHKNKPIIQGMNKIYSPLLSLIL